VKVEKKKFRKFKLGKCIHFGFRSLNFLNFFYYIIYNRIKSASIGTKSIAKRYSTGKLGNLNKF